MENPYRELSNINPQRDDGNRQINNDIWRALMRANISGGSYKIIMCVIDRTWGYNKLESKIGYSIFMRSTGLTKPTIRNCIKELVDKHILIMEPGNFNESANYLFNKYYDTWTCLPVLISNTGNVDVTTPGIKDFTTPGKMLTRSTSFAKENIKENIKEREIYPYKLKKRKNGGGLYNPAKDDPTRLFKGKLGHLVQGGPKNDE